MTTFTGADAVGAYRLEDNGFNTDPSAGGYKSFGRNVTIDTFEGANNGVELFQFCNRAPTQVVEQNFEGTWSVSFIASSFQWLEIFDSTATDEDGDADSNDIDYDLSDAQTFEMVVQRKESSTDITRVATGCVPQSLEIDVSVDGLVEVSIDGIYAGEKKLTGTEISTGAGNYSQIADNKDALNFADVTFDYNGSALELPRGVTISLENATTALSVLGNREAGDFTQGPTTGSVDITHAVEVDETTTLESMYGGASGTSDSVSDDNNIVITLDNGNASGSGQVKAVVTMPGFTESYSESGIDVEEDFVEADITETLAGEPNIEVTED